MRGGANCLCDDDLDAGVDTELLSKLDNKDIEMEEAYQQAGSEGAMKRFKTAVDAIIKTQRERRKRGPGFADVVKEAMGTGWARVRDLAQKGQKGGGLDVDVQVAYKEFYEIVMSGDMAAFNGTDPNQNSKEWKFCPSELSKHALFLEALKQKIGKTQLLEGFKNYRAHCVWPIMNYYERIFKFYRVASDNTPRKTNRGSTPYLILNQSDIASIPNLEIKFFTTQELGLAKFIGFWPGKEKMTPKSVAINGLVIPPPKLFKDFLDDNHSLPAHNNDDLGGMSGYIYILMKKYYLPSLSATDKQYLARLLIYVACISVQDILWYHCCIHPDILRDAGMEVLSKLKTERYSTLVRNWRGVREPPPVRRLAQIKYISGKTPTLKELEEDEGVRDMWKGWCADTIAKLLIFLSADTTNLFETIGYEKQVVDVAGKRIILKESKKEVSKREQVVGLYPYWVLHDIIHPPSSGGTGDWINLYKSLSTPIPPLQGIANKIKQFYTDNYPSIFPTTQHDEMGMLVAQRNSLSRLAITAECEYALRDQEDMKTRFGLMGPYDPNKKISYFSGYVFQDPDTGDYYWTPDCEHIFPYKYVALYFGQPLIGEHFTVLNSSKRIRQNELLQKLHFAINSVFGTLLPSKIADLWTDQGAWDDFSQIHYSELQNFYGWGESSVNRFIKGDKLVYNVAFVFDPADPANVTDVSFTPTPTAGGGGIIWDTMLKSEGPYLPHWEKRFRDSGNYKFLYLSGVPQRHMELTTAYGEDLNTRFNNADRHTFWMNDGHPGYDEAECLHIQLLKKVIAPSHKLDDYQIRNNLSTLKIINHFIITTSMLLYSFPKIKFNDGPSGVEVGQKFLKYAIYWIWKFLTLFIKKTTLSSLPGDPPDAIRDIIILAILETYYTPPIIKTKIESAILSLDAKAKKKKT